MENDFLSEAKSFFSPEFVNNMALSLNEEAAAVNRAMEAVIPLSVGAIIQKANTGKEAVAALYNSATNATDYFPAKPDLGKLHDEGAGSALVSEYLGTHATAVSHAVARYAGIKNESGGPLFTLSLPMLMRKLGEMVKSKGHSAEDLGRFVNGLKDSVKDGLPAGIEKVGALVGLSADQIDEKHIKDYVESNVAQPKNKGWVLPIILVLLGLALLIYFSKGCSSTTGTVSGLSFLIH